MRRWSGTALGRGGSESLPAACDVRIGTAITSSQSVSGTWTGPASVAAVQGAGSESSVSAFPSQQQDWGGVVFPGVDLEWEWQEPLFWGFSVDFAPAEAAPQCPPSLEPGLQTQSPAFMVTRAAIRTSAAERIMSF